MASHRTRLATLVAACIALAPLGASALTEEEARRSEWFSILSEATSKNRLACAGAGDDAACAAEVAGVEAAMAASDATDSVRHFLSQRLLDTLRVRAANLIERRDYARADTVVSEASARMMAHYDGGKHFHVLLDSIGLMNQVAVLRIRQERWDEADAVIGLARMASDRAWAGRANVGDAATAKERFRGTVADTEVFESSIADAYRDLSESRTGDKTALQQKAYEAYGRAADWTRRADEIGVAKFAAARADVRYAGLKMEQGRMAKHMGKGDDARARYGEAIDVACREADPSQASGRSRMDDEHLEALCGRVSELDFIESPEYAKAFDTAFDAWYDKQLEMLEGE